jgi:hypothetical protein
VSSLRDELFQVADLFALGIQGGNDNYFFQK